MEFLIGKQEESAEKEPVMGHACWVTHVGGLGIQGHPIGTPHSVLFGWDGFCVRRICPADELAGVAESNPEMGKSSRTPVLTRGATTGCDFLSSVGFRRRI